MTEPKRTKITCAVIIIVPIIIVAAILFVVFGILFPRPTRTTIDCFWLHRFVSIEEIHASSNGVVRGQVISINHGTTRQGDSGISITSFIEYQIKITDVFDGWLQNGDVITVTQHTQSRSYSSGEVSWWTRRAITHVNYTPLQLEDDVILFLLSSNQPLHPIRRDRFYMSEQSAFYCLQISSKHKTMFRGVSANNDLQFTMQQLRDMLHE